MYYFFSLLFLLISICFKIVMMHSTYGHQSIYPAIYLFICLSVYLYIALSVWWRSIKVQFISLFLTASLHRKRDRKLGNWQKWTSNWRPNMKLLPGSQWLSGDKLNFGDDGGMLEIVSLPEARISLIMQHLNFIWTQCDSENKYDIEICTNMVFKGQYFILCGVTEYFIRNGHVKCIC